MMQTPSPRVTSALIARTRLSLRLTQGDLAERLSVTRRTVGRWEGARSAPSFAQLRQLAVDVHPHDAALAREIADEAGVTLETLGLVLPTPPAPVEPASFPVRSFPPIDLMVDSILHVSARALSARSMSTDDPVANATSVLRAAFERARGLGLTVEEVDAALASKADESGVASKGAPRGSAHSRQS
jgi:DNA-binding XRE family transcriptional regulator